MSNTPKQLLLTATAITANNGSVFDVQQPMITPKEENTFIVSMRFRPVKLEWGTLSLEIQATEYHNWFQKILVFLFFR
jgi:hypothetical protein